MSRLLNPNGLTEQTILSIMKILDLIDLPESVVIQCSSKDVESWAWLTKVKESSNRFFLSTKPKFYYHKNQLAQHQTQMCTSLMNVRNKVSNNFKIFIYVWVLFTKDNKLKK